MKKLNGALMALVIGTTLTTSGCLSTALGSGLGAASGSAVGGIMSDLSRKKQTDRVVNAIQEEQAQAQVQSQGSDAGEKEDNLLALLARFRGQNSGQIPQWVMMKLSEMDAEQRVQRSAIDVLRSELYTRSIKDLLEDMKATQEKNEGADGDFNSGNGAGI